MVENIINRNYRYILEIIYTFFAIPVIKVLAKTIITPNMITLSNLLLLVITCCLLFCNKYIYLAAILILSYYFLDTLDGGLARYSGKTTEFGAKLDRFTDAISYNMLIICCGLGRVSINLILILVALHNFYSIATTYYILPNLEEIKGFRRFGLKKFFMNRGIILGVDVSLLGSLLAIAICTNKSIFIYKLLITLYIIDLIYRVLELWINMYLDRKR